ncbi:thiol oxidoreductase, partial [Pseudomonas syringae pv. tagetis]
DQNAFSMPSGNLAPVGRLDFRVGYSFFVSTWVFAPSTNTARVGLGPLFNPNASNICNITYGRGHRTEAEESIAGSMRGR